MRLLGRLRPPATPEHPASPDDVAERRGFAQRCAYCFVVTERLVYCDNRKSYCRDCFFRVRALLHLESIGQRAADLDPWDELNHRSA